MPQTTEKNSTPPSARFFVHQNVQGYWMASEKGGLVTGIFPVQREALRFALSHLHTRADCRQSRAPKPR
jgi:hypothetical protein